MSTPKRISILFLSFTLLDSDLHKSTFINILEQLAKSGNKVAFLALRSKRVYNNENNKQIKIMAIPLRYQPFLSTLMFMVLQLIFLPFYLLFSKTTYVIYDSDVHILSSFPVVLIAKLTGKKVVLDIRSTPVETAGLKGSLRKFWFSISVLVARKFFDGITIITPFMKKKICDDYNISPERVGVWTSGVSEQLFNPSKYKDSDLRKQFKLENKFIVLYHGVFTPTRALKETIQAVALLLPKYPEIVLLFLGSGSYLNDLEALVKKEKLNEQVIFAKPVDHPQVPEYISMCDLGIVPLPDHPYWRFQSPLKLFEYLAMEKVVILTDIPAHRTVIGTEKCGVYVKSVNPKDLADGIEKAYLNKGELKTFGRAGRILVKQKYTWSKVSEDLERYLCAL